MSEEGNTGEKKCYRGRGEGGRECPGEECRGGGRGMSGEGTVIGEDFSGERMSKEGTVIGEDCRRGWTVKGVLLGKGIVRDQDRDI